MLKAVGIVAIWASLSAAAAASEPPPQPPATIRVVAEASIGVKPDQAEIELGVTTAKKTAAATVAENAHKMEQVLTALKKEVGPDADLKTAEISVRPRFEETKNGQLTARIVGYTATNTVRVRLANITLIAKVLDLALQSGANTVERVELGLKDPDAAQNQALRAASARARARATAMADGQGLHVGEVVSVSEGGGADLEGGGVAYRKSANVTPMPIEPGSVEVRAAVTVIYGLKAR